MRIQLLLNWSYKTLEEHSRMLKGLIESFLWKPIENPLIYCAETEHYLDCKRLISRKILLKTEKASIDISRFELTCSDYHKKKQHQRLRFCLYLFYDGLRDVLRILSNILTAIFARSSILDFKKVLNMYVQFITRSILE